MAHTIACMAYTVKVSNLEKSYGEHVVLTGVHMQIGHGSVYALLGPNGAGKTTLVRTLATLTPADSGTASIAGHDLASEARSIRAKISLTGQFAAIDEMLTAEENLQMMAQLRKFSAAEARSRARELLWEFDLIESRNRRAVNFSGGMKRRLDLAISMISRPALLFLDEPTTGLDPRSREHVWAAVSTLVADGVTILLTTQYLEEADRLAHNVGVLNHGRIIAEGSPAELKAAAGVDLVSFEFDDINAYQRAVALFPDARSDAEQRMIDVPTDGSAREMTDLIVKLNHDAIRVRRISTKRPTLDDVFRHLTDQPTVTAEGVS